MSTEIHPPLLGIFVGGRSRRMGGEPKGLLEAPDTGESIVAKLARLGREAGMRPVLVGDATPYAGLGLSAIADDPEIAGPLGGLAALLDHAGERDAIAVACDMPHVTAGGLGLLADHPWDGAAVVAPTRGPDAPWEPLFARYRSPRVLPILREAAAEGVRSFQGLYARLTVRALPLAGEVEAALHDWNSPEDIG